jgi:flagellar basal body rod protein FlgC
MDPIATARYGLLAASNRFETAATRIASAPSDNSVDLATQFVEVIQAKHAFSANLSVIRYAQDMWDSLLAIQAR